MKIANVIRRLAFDEWGGTETAVWNTAKVHAALGHTPQIFGTTALCDTRSETVDGISIRRFPYFYPQLFLKPQARIDLDKKGGNPLSFPLAAAVERGGFDIVHSHSMGRLAKQARKAARKSGVPFVISFHGGCYDVPASEFAEMAKPLKGTIGYGPIIELILRLDSDIVESADGVICVGENELEEVRKRFPEKPSAAIPNGVDIMKFSAQPNADFKAEYKIPRERKLILCVSRIDYQKNQRMLVSMLKALLARGDNPHVAVVGFPTSKSYLGDLRADIITSKLSDRFTIVEGLPPDSDTLVSAYKQADVFVLPSVHEPFGIVALEAWSAGLPLAASKVGGLGRLVRDGENGFAFSSGSVDELVAAYDRAIGDEGAEAAKRAHLEARDKYSWESVGARILDFYAEVSDVFKRK